MNKVKSNSTLAITVFSLLTFSLVPAEAKEARTLRLSEKQVGRIYVQAGRSTVLNFPVKPTKVILGNRGVFAVEYVENDLAVSPLSQSGKSNLFVYIPGRRFAFDLVPSSTNADQIVLVRDSFDQQMKVNVK